MRLFLNFVFTIFMSGYSLPVLWAQDLVPRAYTITPIQLERRDLDLLVL